MTHGTVEDHISKILTEYGITDHDLYEEFLDHYLSVYEAEIAAGFRQVDALANTSIKIKAAQLEFVSAPKSKYNWKIVSLVLIAISLILFFVNPNNTNPIPSTQLEQEIKNPDSNPTAWPVANNSNFVTSDFGPRLHPIFKKHRHHDGIDIKAQTGTLVLSPSSGVVMECGYDKMRGNYIVIKHNEMITTKYFHLSELSVKSCDEVQLGSTIGKVGNTGLGTNPHLHFEILEYNTPVDPLEYIRP